MRHLLFLTYKLSIHVFSFLPLGKEGKGDQMRAPALNKEGRLNILFEEFNIDFLAAYQKKR